MAIYVDKILEDKDFGHIYIRTNARAVRYTFHPANDGTRQCGLIITVPTLYDLSNLLETISQLRERLLVMVQREAKRTPTPTSCLVNWDFQINSDCLHISVVKLPRGASFSLHHEPEEIEQTPGVVCRVTKPAIMQLCCPEDTDFTDPQKQQWLQKVVIEGIRKHAKVQLPPRLIELALLHQIELNGIKVNASSSHWGSCARHRQRGFLRGKVYFNINLSLYTLLLPLSLQRLILLHELCHTKHMDHSPQFHSQLDLWLDGQERALEQQLKRYSTKLESFLEITDNDTK